MPDPPGKSEPVATTRADDVALMTPARAERPDREHTAAAPGGAADPQMTPVVQVGVSARTPERPAAPTTPGQERVTLLVTKHGNEFRHYVSPNNTVIVTTHKVEARVVGLRVQRAVYLLGQRRDTEEIKLSTKFLAMIASGSQKIKKPGKKNKVQTFSANQIEEFVLATRDVKRRDDALASLTGSMRRLDLSATDPRIPNLGGAAPSHNAQHTEPLPESAADVAVGAGDNGSPTRAPAVQPGTPVSAATRPARVPKLPPSPVTDIRPEANVSSFAPVICGTGVGITNVKKESFRASIAKLFRDFPDELKQLCKIAKRGGPVAFLLIKMQELGKKSYSARRGADKPAAVYFYCSHLVNCTPVRLKVSESYPDSLQRVNHVDPAYLEDYDVLLDDEAE